jgi:hypothetical protein
MKLFDDAVTTNFKSILFGLCPSCLFPLLKPQTLGSGFHFSLRTAYIYRLEGNLLFMQLIVWGFPRLRNACALHSDPSELLPHVPLRHAVASLVENCEPITVNMWIKKVTCISFAVGYTPLTFVWLVTKGNKRWYPSLVRVNNITAARLVDLRL